MLVPKLNVGWAWVVCCTAGVDIEPGLEGMNCLNEKSYEANHEDVLVELGRKQFQRFGKIVPILGRYFHIRYAFCLGKRDLITLNLSVQVALHAHLGRTAA